MRILRAPAPHPRTCQGIELLEPSLVHPTGSSIGGLLVLVDEAPNDLPEGGKSWRLGANRGRRHQTQEEPKRFSLLGGMLSFLFFRVHCLVGRVRFFSFFRHQPALDG